MSEAAQKVYGLGGITLGACAFSISPYSYLCILHSVSSIVQAFATLAVGLIIGLIYIWKVGLVGLGMLLTLINMHGLSIDTKCLT